MSPLTAYHWPATMQAMGAIEAARDLGLRVPLERSPT